MKRFLEYKPPLPPSSEAIQHHQGQRLRSRSPLHHYRLSTDQVQRPGGMACSPSPAASVTSPRESSVHPRARPLSGPKAKFTLEDDALLLELKEQHELTWKKISEFFPGRSSGTLQVRYCTKLKAKGVSWTDDMVHFTLPPLHSPPALFWLSAGADALSGWTTETCHVRVRKRKVEDHQQQGRAWLLRGCLSTEG